MIVDELDDCSDSNISPGVESIDDVGDRGVTDSHSESSFCSGTSKSSTSKQSTQFNTDWLVGRSWLRYTAEVGMTCFLCVKHKQRSFNNDIWTTSRPCQRIRLQSVMKHEQSAAHRNSVPREAAAALRTGIASAVNLAVPARGIEKAFSCLYFLAKKRIAHTTNFEPLLDLFGFLGMNIKGMLGTAKMQPTRQISLSRTCCMLFLKSYKQKF